MKNLENEICRVEDVLYQNQCLTELIQGYCLNFANTIDEMNNLLFIIDIILKNQKKLQKDLDAISMEICRLAYPDFF